jgi:hypothetical protein
VGLVEPLDAIAKSLYNIGGTDPPALLLATLEVPPEAAVWTTKRRLLSSRIASSVGIEVVTFEGGATRFE